MAVGGGLVEPIRLARRPACAPWGPKERSCFPRCQDLFTTTKKGTGLRISTSKSGEAETIQDVQAGINNATVGSASHPTAFGHFYWMAVGGSLVEPIRRAR